MSAQQVERGVALGQRVALDMGALRALPTGVGVYVGRLADALLELAPEVVLPIGLRAEVTTPAPGGATARPFRGRNYQSWLQLRAAADARQAGASLVHYTNASAPLVGRLPFVLTVQDLSLLRMPLSHPAPRLVIVPLVLAAIARARAILVPSRATALEMGRLLGVRRRVALVPLAARALEGRVTDVAERLGLSAHDYLVAVATLEPRKNHVRLIDAFELVAAGRPSLQLVLAGGPGWHARPILARIAASPLAGRITVTGYLDEADLVTLVGSAAAMCYVSLYEGFGLPIVEAMAAGTPVVTSNLSSMPEAAGGAAVLVDPLDAADIARGIERALAERGRLGAAGRLWAGKRSWRDVAAETLAVYRWALARR